MFKSSNYCIDCKKHLSHSDNYTTYTMVNEQYLRCQICEDRKKQMEFAYHAQFRNAYKNPFEQIG